MSTETNNIGKALNNLTSIIIYHSIAAEMLIAK